ncbi:hypothetical protein HZH66_011931 [Vespula vulgaris]|uniref:Cyclic nucleotide-binding domain-containing protein n=2 Tax=Vespula vulgaris TaxID=7454 RepID=A0A834MUE8_VESVU|nr:hypothetical protein HZH66_011931 [Vespula vulgaris]
MEGEAHVCELLRTLENWRNITYFSECKRLCSQWFNIDKRTPRCMRYIDNMSAVNIEKRRYGRLKNFWIIHPFSYFKFLWETLMMVVYAIAFFTIPFMISFIVMDYEVLRLDKVNLFIYIMCWLDIIVTCMTGYYDKKNMRVELNLLKIFKKYLKGYLLVDIISSLPYDHITLFWRKLPGNSSFYEITLINLLPLLKLTRYPTLNDYIFHFYQYFAIEYFYYQLTTTLALGFYLIIWFSCLCYLLPVLMLHFYNIPSTECQDCWMVGLENEGLAFRFQHAFFIVLENLLASGYGVFPPKTDVHIVLNIVLMIFGRFIECYIIIMFLQVKRNSKAAKSKYQEIINQIGAYARQKQLPFQIKNRLLEYYNYRFKENFFRERNIQSILSERLRDEIAMQSCRRLVENVTLFKNVPQDILKSIIKNLKFELYLRNDVIIRAGSIGDCMFFLSIGTVSVLTPTGKEICHLHDGAHFGEIALLASDQKRVATVIAIDISEVYRLDRKDFRKSVAVHSELLSSIERIATERIERTAIIEEHHKRFIMRSSFAHDEARRRSKTS